MALGTLMRDYIRYEGLSHLPRIALKALTRLDFHIFMISKGDPTPDIQPPAGLVTFEDALARLNAMRDERIHSANEFWRDRVHGTSSCATVAWEGQLAAVGWVYEYPAKRPLVTLTPGAAELSGFYTVERFRRRGCYRALLHTMVKWQLRERDRLLIVAASDNPQSIDAIRSVGFREVAVIRRRPIGGAKFSAAPARSKEVETHVA